jgi:hypothetical protein
MNCFSCDWSLVFVESKPSSLSSLLKYPFCCIDKFKKENEYEGIKPRRFKQQYENDYSIGKMNGRKKEKTERTQECMKGRSLETNTYENYRIKTWQTAKQKQSCTSQSEESDGI